MDFKIENILEEDIDRIYELGMGEKDFSADGGENCFWPKETLKKLIKSKEDVTLKLSVNNKIVGFSLVMIHQATRKAIIENFYVLKEYNFLEKDFLNEVENQIKLKGAEFVAYFYDTKDDCNELELFEDYFKGNEHLWLHKNISFNNPAKKNN